MPHYITEIEGENKILKNKIAMLNNDNEYNNENDGSNWGDCGYI